MTEIQHSPIDACGLATLEARLQEELRFLCYPGKDWVPRQEGVTDVLRALRSQIDDTRLREKKQDEEPTPWQP